MSTLRQAQDELAVATKGRGLFDVTRSLREFSSQHGAREGLLTVFIRHTSASLLVQENAAFVSIMESMPEAVRPQLTARWKALGVDMNRLLPGYPFAL